MNDLAQVATIHQINLTQESMAKYKAKDTLFAIQEIIWNSIDADASTISVDFTFGELGLIESLSIEDNGCGFAAQTISSDICQLSKSSKKNKTHSPSGKRSLHGKRGEGFYKIAHIGNVEWETCSGRSALKCKVNLEKINITSEPIIISESTYTKVLINHFYDTNGLSKDSIMESIVLKSLISFEQYNITLNFDGAPYNFKTLYRNSKEYPATSIFKEKLYHMEIKVIEIDKEELSNSNKIIILAQDKTVVKEFSHQIKSPLNKPISIYLTVEEFTSDTVITELDIENEIREFAKEEINRYIQNTSQDDELEFKKKLSEQEILPMVLRQEEQKLSAIAKQEKTILEDTLYILKKYDKIGIGKARSVEKSKLVAEVIHRAIIQGDENLIETLQHILKLQSAELQEFSELLKKTPLPNVMKLANEVSHRLRLVSYLELLFMKGGEDNINIKERSQLQKLINENMWLLSEDFAFYTADKSLNTWAKQTIEKLKLKTVELDLNKISGTDIPDYVICSHKKGRDDHYDYLVVEIKRPDYILNQDNVYKETQEYMDQIIELSPSDKNKSSWEMWFLVTKINSSVKNWKDRKRGLQLEPEDSNYKIYIKEWGEIIQQKKAELDYLNKTLDLKIDTDSSKDYILKKYPFMNIK